MHNRKTPSALIITNRRYAREAYDMVLGLSVCPSQAGILSKRLKCHYTTLQRCAAAQSLYATVCKTVRPMLSDRCLTVCLSVLSVCNVGALWPNGWMDPDETWHALQVGLGLATLC